MCTYLVFSSSVEIMLFALSTLVLFFHLLQVQVALYFMQIFMANLFCWFEMYFCSFQFINQYTACFSMLRPTKLDDFCLRKISFDKEQRRGWFVGA